MNIQRASLALSAATFCLVLVVLFLVIRERSPRETNDTDLQPANQSHATTNRQLSQITSRKLSQPSVPLGPGQSGRITHIGAVRTNNTTSEVGGQSSEKSTEPPPVSPPPREELIPLAATVGGLQPPVLGAAVIGRVNWSGSVSTRKKIKMDADPKCAAMHPDPVFTEDLIVNDDKTLRNVFVYVKEGLEQFEFEPNQSPVVLEQRSCMYVPHVLGMMARQPLKIINDDDTLHNIHALPKNSPEFNKGQPNQGMEMTRTFQNPEVMVRVKCDVHPWMSAYIGVLNHPFFDVTGNDGTFQLQGLPPGKYLIVAWHEVYGVQSQLVALAGDETKEINFSFQK